MKWPSFMSRLAALWRQLGEERVYVPQRQAGVNVTEDTAMTLAEWWACVSVISRTVASLPWAVFERSESGRREVYGSVSWLLNNQPNPEMGAFSFREALVAHALNWGNGYAEIQRDLSGRPVYLWLLTPDRVTPKRRQDSGNLYYEVQNDEGALIELETSQVLHLHGLGYDGVTGYSIVKMAARSIGIGIAQDTFAGSFYQNGTVMGAIVKVGAGTTPDQIKQLESYYNEGKRGPSKAFGVKVALAGTELQQLGMPLTDAQFIESRQLTVTMAARWLGVPPHKIADLTRSTNNNIEHQGIEFVTDAIIPWAMRLEQEADGKLFGMRSQGRVYTKLNVNALMRGDAKSRAEFYRTMTQIGAFTINKVLALEDMDGIGPNGDVRLVQLNQTTLDYLVSNPGAKANASNPLLDKSSDIDDDDSPDTEDEATPSNVIRAEALRWLREQRKQA